MAWHESLFNYYSRCEWNLGAKGRRRAEREMYRHLRGKNVIQIAPGILQMTRNFMRAYVIYATVAKIEIDTIFDQKIDLGPTLFLSTEIVRNWVLFLNASLHLERTNPSRFIEYFVAYKAVSAKQFFVPSAAYAYKKKLLFTCLKNTRYSLPCPRCGPVECTGVRGRGGTAPPRTPQPGTSRSESARVGLAYPPLPSPRKIEFLLILSPLKTTNRVGFYQESSNMNFDMTD